MHNSGILNLIIFEWFLKEDKQSRTSPYYSYGNPT